MHVLVILKNWFCLTAYLTLKKLLFLPKTWNIYIFSIGDLSWWVPQPILIFIYSYDTSFNQKWSFNFCFSFFFSIWVLENKFYSLCYLKMEILVNYIFYLYDLEIFSQSLSAYSFLFFSLLLSHVYIFLLQLL